MKRTFNACIVLIAAATISQTAHALDEYRLDDGVKESGVGFGTGGASKSFAWLNHFTAKAGAEVITEIRIGSGTKP